MKKAIIVFAAVLALLAFTDHSPMFNGIVLGVTFLAMAMFISWHFDKEDKKWNKQK